MYYDNECFKYLPTWIVELVQRSGNIMECHATAQGSIPGRNGVLIELHVLCKGQ